MERTMESESALEDPAPGSSIAPAEQALSPGEDFRGEAWQAIRNGAGER
jgi:hypothetical protein